MESFQELALTKSIDKITIQDIVNNCGYSPATFYRKKCIVMASWGLLVIGKKVHLDLNSY